MKVYFTRFLLCLTWIFIIFSTIRMFTSTTFFSNESNKIHLFTWPEQFHHEILKEFEKTTGIEVVVHTYTTNEELVAKMKKTAGKGYDLIVPSDYAVKVLRKENLLKKIDKKKLNFYKNLDPFLLNRDFDPNNDYSLPFDWEVFGFGINRDFKTREKITPTWNHIFNKKMIDYRICMSNDPIEAIQFASFYLFGTKKELDQEEEKKLENLLIEQKKWVEAYSAMRGDYLLTTHNCQIALSTSPFILKAIEKNPHIEFVLPKGDVFITIQMLSLPKASKKTDLVYQFINFLYQKETMIKDCNTYLTFPSIVDAYEHINLTKENRKILEEVRQERNKTHVIDFVLPEHQARKLWVKVKSS